MTDEAYALARIIQGEAGVCPLLAMLSVAFLFQRNSTMYGDAEPSNDAIFIALFWRWFADPTPTAKFMFSAQDLEQERVQTILAGRGPPVAIWNCAGGLSLWLFE